MPTPLEMIKKRRQEATEKIMQKGYRSKKRVYVGMATCEIAAGSQPVMDVFQQAARDGLIDVYLTQKGCAGRCNLEPTVEVIEWGNLPAKYGKVTADMARQIIERHIKKGEVIKEWLIK